jgi:hypothetical protein
MVALDNLYRIFTLSPLCFIREAAIRALSHKGIGLRSFRMSIQDYARSISATRKVSKDQVFRYLEMQFSRIDRDHDGALDIDELAVFEHAVAWPEADQR